MGNEPARSYASLPRLGEIYDCLRGGRHVTRKQSELFHHLDEREEAYRELFEELGYDLIRHEKDFFYFEKEDYFSGYAKRFTTFVFVIIDYYADRGRLPEDLLTQETFNVDEKPFDDHEKKRHREVLEKVGIDFDEPRPYDQLLSDLERFGFVERDGAYHFRFEKPVFRFLDLAKDIAAHVEEADDE